MGTRLRFGLLLVAALTGPWDGAIRAQPPSDRQARARGFAIIAAQYGSDERWIDVTEVLRSRARDGGLDMPPNRLPDPAYGIHKNLVVLFTINGKAGLALARDDKRIVIPGRVTTFAIPETGFAVLSALYGREDKWVNVTGPLRGWIKDGRLAYPNPSGAALPDPVVGSLKALVVAYSVDGEPHLYVGREGKTVTLPEADPGRVRRASDPTQLDLDYLKLMTDAVRDLKPADLLRLEALDLAGKPIDGAGLAHLRGLEGLRTLSLAGTQVNDPGLRNIAGLGGLRSLDLSDTPIGDPGMQSVARLAELRTLSLRKTKVTNAGLARVARLAELEDLDLSGTKITDAGLSDLRRLAKLRHLRLSRAGLTDAGIAGLKKAIPGLQVEVER